MAAFFPTPVLVGVDGSEAARHARAAATELATATGSPLHLVHVKLTAGTLRGRPMTPEQRERGDAEGEELLRTESAAVVAAGGEVAGTHLRYAERTDTAFAAVQRELDAGLLVIGERGSGSLARRMAAISRSDAGGTVRRAPASVLVVRH